MGDLDRHDNGQLFPEVGSRSVDSQEIRVRFVNRCPYSVDVFWLNNHKQPTKYGTLREKQYLDIKTFRNHPWVSRRCFDGCKLLLNMKLIYWPEPPARTNLIIRNHCDITPRVQSLQEMASRSLLKEGPARIEEKLSCLPRELQFEVKHLLDTKREYDEIVCRQVAIPRSAEGAGPPSPPAPPSPPTSK